MDAFNRDFLSTLKNKYADFNGRATRSEYWYFVLFYILISIVAQIIDTFVINPLLGATSSQAGTGGILQILFVLAVLIPFVAVAIRRLHDTNRSGWWFLIGFVPLI